MLETLLRIVATKGTADCSELARMLGVSSALTENMLDELTRQGYLKAVVGECSVPCERCPLRTACLFRRQPRIWSLTRKGERLLAKRQERAI